MVTLWNSGKVSGRLGSSVVGETGDGAHSPPIGIWKDIDCERFNLKLFFLETQALLTNWKCVYPKGRHRGCGWILLCSTVQKEINILSDILYLRVDCWDCSSASSFCSVLCLSSCRPMGQSSGTENSAIAFLLSSSFRAEAYTLSASRRMLSSTSLIDIFGKSRAASEEEEGERLELNLFLMPWFAVSGKLF